MVCVGFSRNNRNLNGEQQIDLTYLRLGRWRGALKSPTFFQDKIKIVENNLDQVRQLCEELLNKKVDEVKRLNIGKFWKFRKMGDIRYYTS